MKKTIFFFALFVFTVCGSLSADVVTLQNGTATFSQTGAGCFPCGANQATDGNFGPDNSSLANGWSIANATFGDATSQTAVWETSNDVTATGISFSMHFNHFNPQHLLGRFRFSVTSDDRSLFADGLASGGDVNANWSVLQSPQVTGPLGMTFTTLGDQSVLASGTIPDQGTYTVNYTAPLSNVTGIRLEVIEDATLPFFDGPGLHPANGNFILTELVVTSVPEPSSLFLFGTALAYIASSRKRKS